MATERTKRTKRTVAAAEPNGSRAPAQECSGTVTWDVPDWQPADEVVAILPECARAISERGRGMYQGGIGRRDSAAGYVVYELFARGACGAVAKLVRVLCEPGARVVAGAAGSERVAAGDEVALRAAINRQLAASGPRLVACEPSLRLVEG